MADRTTLEATTRTVTGKKVKQLRHAGRLPATVYGHAVKPATIEVDARAFRHVHATAGDTQLIDLVLDGKGKRPVLIHATQIDPRRNTAMHVEFYQANLNEKLTAHIPIRLEGESPATKQGLMVLSNLDSIEIECLPTDLPPDILLDISSLEEVGAAIHVRDLPIDRGKLDVKTSDDEIVVHVVAPRAQVEEEAAEEAEAAEEEAAAAAASAEGAASGEESEG